MSSGRAFAHGAAQRHANLSRGHGRRSADPLERLDSKAMEQGTATATVDDRPYSPGLEGVLAGETSIALVDGANGRLMYRGYPIGELVRHGTYAQVAELLWTGAWPASAHLACAPLSARVLASLRNLPASTHPMDALRTAISTWGAEPRPGWPSTVDQARALTAVAPTALAAFARLREGKEPRRAPPGPRARGRLPVPAQRHGARPRRGACPRRLLHRGRGARVQRLDLHGARHHARPARTSRAPSAAPSARSRARSTAARRRRS